MVCIPRNWMLCKPQCQRISNFSNGLISSLFLLFFSKLLFEFLSILTHTYLTSFVASALFSMMWTCNLIILSPIIWQNFAQFLTIWHHWSMGSIHCHSTNLPSSSWSNILLLQNWHKLKMLSLNLDPFDPAPNQPINFCLNWLTSGEQDQTVPKFLEVYFCSEVQQFSKALKQVIRFGKSKYLHFPPLQQFLSAKRPSTFVIKFICYGDFGFQLDLENTIGEQLHGQSDEAGYFWIYRYSEDSNRTQLKEWFEEMIEKRNNSSRIEIHDQLTIRWR